MDAYLYTVRLCAVTDLFFCLFYIIYINPLEITFWLEVSAYPCLFALSTKRFAVNDDKLCSTNQLQLIRCNVR